MSSITCLSHCAKNNSPLSVALWVPRYWPAMGGTELHTRELSHRLARNNNVQVITHCDNNANVESTIEQDVVDTISKYYLDGNVRINRLGMAGHAGLSIKTMALLHQHHRWSRPFFSHLFRHYLSHTLRAKTESLDVIHYIYNGLSDSAYLAAATASLASIPFVFTPNVLDTTTSPTAWNSPLFIKLYKQATRIIALTDFEKDYLVRLGVASHKISIIPYGPILAETTEMNSFREQANIRKGKIVLFLGRLVPGKGYELLLESRHKLWAQYPDTQIVFIGPLSADAKAILEQIQDPRVHWYENSCQSFKTQALQACDILCVPSSMESLGVVYIEAAACGKPVVALDIPVLRNVIQHNVDGYLVDHNADDIAIALKTLLNDPALCNQFGERAILKVQTLFQWDNITNAITDVYWQSCLEQQQLANAA